MKFCFLVPILIFQQAIAQRPELVEEYIATYKQFAIEEQIRTGIPAAITMAQGIHESGAGLGDLAVKSNNHFGIKCKSTWTGDRIFHDDDEAGECFRVYGCVADSYRDHSDFLRTGQRYSFLFNLSPTDYRGWANGLKRAGYATNPKYPAILIKTIEDNNLEALTDVALQQSGNKMNNDIWLASATVQEKTIVDVAAAEPAIGTGLDGDFITRKELDEKLAADKPSAPKKASVQPKTDSKPKGIIRVNNCKAIFAPAGTSLKALAKQQGISFSDLLAYNDMKPTDKLTEGQLVFLEEKKKKGSNHRHEVQRGETAWLISQQEGIRLKKLLEYNHLAMNTRLKAGQVIYLKGSAPR